MGSRRGKTVLKYTGLNLQKVVCQIRYKPLLRRLSKIATAGEEFVHYPHWSAGPHAVILKNYESRCSLNIRHADLAYEQDNADESIEQKNIEEALRLLPPKLEITTCSRFGYRRIYLCEVKTSFDDLVVIMATRLLARDSGLLDILPKKTTDIAYVLDASDDSYEYHIRVGPVRKAEIPLRVGFNREAHLAPKRQQEDYQKVLDAYPECAILYDVDIFSHDENLKVEDALEFTGQARAKVQGFVASLTKYMLNTKLEE